MNKKILNIGIMIILIVMLVSLTGCGSSKDKEDENKRNGTVSEEFNIRNNKNYFVIINGTRFNAGDKISSITKIGLKQNEKDLNKEIPSNRYLDSTAILDANSESVCDFVPINVGKSTITVANANIGGFFVGDVNFNLISKEILNLNIEIYGGIKLGSSYKDIEKVFGEPDEKKEYKVGDESFKENKEVTLAYTRYKYSSGYKSFSFIVDATDKVSGIGWTNYSFDD